MITGGIYNMLDNTKCEDPARLKADAEIMDVRRKVVAPPNQGTARYRTTVIFNDGFEYISHYSHSKQTGLTSYQISIGPEENLGILQQALDKLANKNTKAL